MGNSTSEQKKTGLAVGYGASAIELEVGIGLLFAGPVGWVAGGILIGAGASSLTNTIQQNCSDKNEFKYDQWGISTGVGAAGGAIAAPFSVGGGLAAGAMTSTAAKVATVVAAETVGGAISNGSTTLISKAANGEKVTIEDFGRGAAVGAIGGAVGAGAGQVASKVAGSIGSKAAGTVAKEVGNKSTTAARVLVRSVIEAAGNAGGAALATFVENVITQGKIPKEDFCKLFGDNNKEAAEEIWKFLISSKIIIDGKICNLNSSTWADFPYDEAVEKEIRKFLAATFDLSRGVGEAAAHGAAMGSAMGAVGHMAERHALKRQVRKDAKARSTQVKKGAKGGTLEIDALVRSRKSKDPVKVNVHKDDGSITTHGPANAKAEINLHYTPSDGGHYSPADKSGQPTKPPTSGTGATDCLYESLAAVMKETPAKVRAEVAKTLTEHPISSCKETQMNKVSTGGKDLGGGSRPKKHEDTKKPIKFENKMEDVRILELFFKEEGLDVPTKDIHSTMKDLKRMPERQMDRKYIEHDHARMASESQSRIHTIGDLNDQYSITFRERGQAPTEAGKVRALFGKNKQTGEYKLTGITATHNYDGMEATLRSFKQNNINKKSATWQLNKKK